MDRLTQAIAMGAPYELACKYAGICYSTLRNWLLAGEHAKTGPAKDLYDAVQAAEGRMVIGCLAKIEKAANEGNWTAAAWKLERRHPEHFGRQIIEHRVQRVREEAERIAAERHLPFERLWATVQELAGRTN